MAQTFLTTPRPTGRLEVGESVTGNIGSNGDEDAFAIEMVQGRTYRFDLEGSETEQGTLADPRIKYLFGVDSAIACGRTVCLPEYR